MNFGRVMPHADGGDALIAANSAAQVGRGVLAVRDAGCAWGGVPRELPGGPRLQRAGRIIAPPGRGYPNVCVDAAPDQLIRTAMDDVEAGAHWVKFIADFPAADGNWFAAPVNYPRALMAELVRTAHASGARVMAHSTGLAVPDLVAAGVDAIEHGMVMTADLVEAMAQQQIAWTSTLATAYKHVGPLAAQQSPVGAYIRGHFDRLRALFPLAVAGGVPVLAGADEIGMGVLPRELDRLVESGLTRQQALAAGSTVARTFLRFPAVAAGARADLVTYAADPRGDLAVLSQPAAIVYDGSVITPAA